MKVGILWDLDGTLLNTLEDLTDSVNHTLALYGCPERTLEEIRTFVGTGAKRLIAQALPGKENDPDVDEVLAAYQEYYATHAQVKTGAYPGVLEALEVLGKRYPMAIVSNKPDKPVKLLCKDYFGEIYALGEAPDCPRKPAADMVFKGMKAIGIDACIYVGDSETDIETAKNAGMPCLSVLWGFRDKETLVAAGGKHFCEDPKQLPQMLSALMEEYYGQ